MLMLYIFNGFLAAFSVECNVRQVFYHIVPLSDFRPCKIVKLNEIANNGLSGRLC